MSVSVIGSAGRGTLARVANALRSAAVGGGQPTGTLMTIGQVARRSGFTVKALRFYERRGLLPPAGRSPGRYRLYTEADLHRLDFIGQAKALGLPIDSIRELVAAAREQPRGIARARLLQVLGERIAQTGAQIAMLERLRKELERRRRAVRRKVPGPSNARGYCTCLHDPAAGGAVPHPGAAWRESADHRRS